jgi:hypothetical protein
MSDFKNTTRLISGHHHWDGHSVWDGRPTLTPPKTPVATNRAGARGAPVQVPVPVSRAAGGPVPQAHDHVHGLHEKGGVKDFKTYGEDHGLVQRSTPMTEELREAGGTTPLRSGFKKGGPAKHFHVHKHFHAKGGRTHSVSHSYSAAEKHAETYAEGGHVHDSTHIPAGGPDYKKGGRTKPVRKNAGGAMYATGGTVNKLAMGGLPTMGAPPAQGALGRLATRPQGLPMRPQLPMRRPMAMPGLAPMGRAGGGTVPMRKVAKQEVAKHVRTAPPRGHGVK